MAGFTGWLKGMLTGNKSVEISTPDVQRFIDRAELHSLEIEEFAVHAAVNLIAGAVSKCEFRTFAGKKEVYGKEAFLWNYQPNQNQNSTQFLQELVSRLLCRNECLVIEINGQLLIADGFLHEEFALLPDRFTCVTRGGKTFQDTFYAPDVLYFRLNQQNIRTALSRLCEGYSGLIQKAVEKYEKSGGRKGTLRVGTLARGDPRFHENFEKLMNDRFKTYFAGTNAVLPLFEGYDYTEQPGEQGKKTTSEVTDVKTLTDEAFNRVAQAFRIPPALLRGEAADLGQAVDNLLTFCVDPLCDMLREEINRKRYGFSEWEKGNYLAIDTSCIRHADLFAVAANVDKLIASGMYCIDELRRKLGDGELGTEHSGTHWITKNYTGLEGGTADEAGRDAD